MANGILDYSRYLQTLQSITDIGNTFPSTQQKFTFSVEGGATSSWIADVEAVTLIVDQVSYNRYDNEPDFSNSTVIGYFEGTATQAQTSTGVIYLPGGIYTGPILPGGTVYVPVTIYNITWTNGTETYSHLLGYIQNWEPGVVIGNPYDAYEFEPIDPLPSTLTLTNSTGLDRIIFEDTLFLIAETDIPIELGDANPVKFYKIVDGEEIYLGQSFYVGQRATFAIETDPDLPIGEYQFIAKTGGRRQYGRQTSNTLDIDVLEGIPLLVLRSEFSPDKEYYFPGDNVEYTLEVYPDPAFTATGFAVTSTTTVRLIDGFPPNTTYIVEEDQFDNGVNTATFVTSATMVDTALTYLNTFTNYTISNSTISGGVYTATLLVWNTESVRTNWGSLPQAKYARGVYTASIQVANTTTVTVTATSFPLVITQNTGSTYLNETFEITVDQPTASYYKPITVFASSGTTTLTLFTSTQPGVDLWTATVSILSTGTWTIYASFPGDIGDSIFNANLPSISNTLSHYVSPGNELLPTPVFTYWTTASSDVLNVWASTSTTLTNAVSFYDGATLLGTSTWVRKLQPIFGQVLYSTGSNYVGSGFARNFENLKNAYNPLGSGSLEDFGFNNTGWGYFEQANPYPNQDWNNSSSNAQKFEYNFRRTNTMTPVGWASSTPAHVTSTVIIFPGYSATNSEVDRPGYQSNMKVMNPIEGSAAWPKNPNKFRLFKYYDGTNYNLTQVTGTNIEAIGDTIEFGTEWTSRLVYVGGFTNPRYLLDAYRFDTIGDSRGYNVIAIAASTSTQRPIVSESVPQRLFFTNPYGADSVKGTSNKERFIDLVEFVGTATWQTAAYDSDYFPNSGAQTISVWLYRFTPEIPQTNTQFKTAYPLDYAFYEIGNEQYFLDVGSLSQYYIDYGRKKWISLNTADAVENDKAEFYNDWFWTFTNPLGTAIRTANSYETTVTNLIPSNTQTVVLNLPLGTISTTTGLRAVWTGTTNLPIEYGKYLGFDIPLTSNPTELTITAKNISALGYNQGDTTATEVLTTSNNVLYSTHQVKLLVDARINTDQYPFPINTGTVDFFKSDGTLIETQSLVDGTAGISLVAEDLSTIDGNTNRSVTVNFNTDAFAGTNTSVINFQVIKNSIGNTNRIISNPAFGSFTNTQIRSLVTLTNSTLDNSYPIQYQNAPVKLIEKQLFGQRQFSINSGISTAAELSIGPILNLTIPPFVRGNRYWKVGDDYNEIYPNERGYFLASIWYSLNDGLTYLPYTLARNDISNLDSKFASVAANSWIFSSLNNQIGPTAFSIGGLSSRQLSLKITDLFTNLNNKTIKFYVDVYFWSPKTDTLGQPAPLQQNAKIYITGATDAELRVGGAYYPILN